jgi:hypothetical protein
MSFVSRFAPIILLGSSVVLLGSSIAFRNSLLTASAWISGIGSGALLERKSRDRTDPARVILEVAPASISDPQPVSAIFIDIENVQKLEDIERYAAENCQHVINVRLAVGNWGRHNKLTNKFNDHGYHLIHINQAQNSADIKLALLSHELALLYPGLREAVIASNDKGLIHLRNQLMSRGIAVHNFPDRLARLTQENDQSELHDSNDAEECLTTSESWNQDLPDEKIQIIKDILGESSMSINDFWSKIKERTGLKPAEFVGRKPPLQRLERMGCVVREGQGGNSNIRLPKKLL